MLMGRGGFTPSAEVQSVYSTVSADKLINFRSDTTEKLGAISLCSYGSKNYVSVTLNGSTVAFLGEGEDATFHPFLHCVLFIHSAA